jgi:Papain family cysteine protease/Cathepsin propeptide inhibitor domain (I29)
MPLNAATFHEELLDHGSVDASGRAREKNTAMDSPPESSSQHSESQERALGTPWLGPENGSNEQVRLFGSRDHDAGNNNRGEATEAACGRSYPSSSSAVNPALYYDPYSPVEVKVSLLDREDDDEEEDGGTSVTGAAQGNTDDNSLENWLEMSDRGDRKEKPVYRRRRGEPSQGPSSALRSPSIAAAGTAGLLEMEDPDVKDDHDNDEEEDEEEEVVFERVGGGGRTNRGIEDDDDDDVYGSSSSSNAPIQTSSGLLLTHRKLPGEQEEDLTSASITSGGGTVRSRHAPSSQPPPGRLEVEHEQSNYYHPHRNHAQGAGGYRHSSSLYPPDPPPGGGGRFASNRFVSSFVPLQRWLSFVRLWVVVSAAVLMLGMTVVVHHMRHETSSSTTAASDNGAANSRVVTNIYQEDKSFSSYNNAENNYYYPDQIILLPLPEGALANHQRIHSHSHHRNLLVDKDEEVDRGLHHLFLQWKKKHDKEYSSHREHAHRFQIWKKNHLRIQKRNEAHGPCKLTAQPVFGTNHLSDLTEEEFQSQYLSGYGVPKSASDPSSQHDHAPPVLDPNAAAVPTEQRQVRRQRDQQRRRLKDTWYEPAKQTSIESCDWYDMSCILRYIFETYFYGLGRTMEPIYDADSYPLMVDWRAVGAVTDVHSQGSCGACWAITAVETVESANYLSTDTLVDLSETEVIACTEDTEWCSGGWPQSAFEYIINQKGIPLETELPYDADYLLTLTEARESGDAYVFIHDAIDTSIRRPMLSFSFTCPFACFVSPVMARSKRTCSLSVQAAKTAAEVVVIPATTTRTTTTAGEARPLATAASKATGTRPRSVSVTRTAAGATATLKTRDWPSGTSPHTVRPWSASMPPPGKTTTEGS